MHDLFVIVPLIIKFGGPKPHSRCCFRKVEQSLPQKRLGECRLSHLSEKVLFNFLLLAYLNLLYFSMSLERSP